MHTPKWMRILSFFLIITFFTGLISPYDRQSASAEGEASDNVLTAERITDRFGVTDAFIQQYIESGYTLNDIYSALYKAEGEDLSFAEALDLLVSEPVNVSSSVSGSVYNDLALGGLQDLIVLEEADLTVTGQVYDPTASESVYDDPSVTEEVYGLPSAATILAAVEPPPIIETAPVYDKTEINEAPYTVGSNQEAISTLSGSLSIGQADLTLPGRGGMSFALNRSYDSSNAQFYDMKVGSQLNNYSVYNYYVQYQADQKRIVTIYQVNYNENRWAEDDYNGDGLIDHTTSILDTTKQIKGTYMTEGAASQAASQPMTYTVPSDSIDRTDTRTSSVNGGFADYVMYSQNGYSGALYKTGTPNVTSGSYIGPQSRNETGSCYNSIPGVYNAQGVWSATGSGTSCPDSLPYSSGGFTGTLTRGTTDTIKACPSPNNAVGVCTKQWKANYSGIVTKPAVDTRMYTQNYRGTATKPAYTSSTRYGAWQSSGSGRWRYAYQISGSQWVQPVPIETSSERVTLATPPTASYDAAVALRDLLAASPGQKIGGDSSFNYYVASTPATTLMSVVVGSTSGYTYSNETGVPLSEQLYPIGKGWTWDLPFVETDQGKQYVYTGGGRYQVEHGTLKGYDWLGTSFAPNTSVSVGGIISASVLTTIDGSIKQYFDGEGRVIRIADAYNNATDFTYTQHSTYGRKLLSQVKDAIGNTIDITYTATNVTLSKGNETVTYDKRTEGGVELLDAVIDAAGRKTSYSYQLADAKFNLMTAYPERAKVNPYALLTEIQHPTGVKTKYTYGTSPVKRYIGRESTNEAYRISSRVDEQLYANNITKSFNHQSFYYNGTDMGQTYGQTFTFSTTQINGLTSVMSQYKKTYFNDETPMPIYLEQQTESIAGVEHNTNYAYTKQVSGRSYSTTSPTSMTKSSNQNADVLTTSTQYDDYGNMVQMTDFKGFTTTYTYDETKKWLISERTPADTGTYLYTAYTRNTLGKVTGITVRKNDAAGEIIQQISYGGIDAYGNVTTQQIANGTKTVLTTTTYGSAYAYAYPTRQNVTVKDADGVSSTITTQGEYNLATGLLTAFIDGRTNRTAYEYDKLGRIKQVTYPGDLRTTVVHDDIGNTLTVTDELGNQTQTKFNGIGMEEESGQFEASGYVRKAKKTYDSFGRLTETEDALGNRTLTEYDSWSRPVKTTLSDGAYTSVVYNETQRKLTTTDALGYSSIQIFDRYGQVTSVDEQLTGGALRRMAQYMYHPYNGQVTQQTDANSETTSMSYDLLGQMTAVTNAKQETTRYEYDKLGNLTKTTYPDGKVQTKEYDELGRLIRAVDPSLKQDRSYYDANSNRIKLIDKAGQIFQYAYSSRNFLLTKQGPSETIAFTYLANGARATMSDGTGMTQYTYKPYTSELEAVIYPDGKRIGYTYNINGQRSEMTTPFADTVGYSYTNRNQLASVSWNGAQQASYTYDGNGQILQQTQTGGMQTEYGYTDSALTSLKLKMPSGTVQQEYGYKYDVNRNITAIIEKIGSVAKPVKAFGYDSLNRISTVSQFNESYTYDVRGNRLGLTTESEVYLTTNASYTYDEWERLTKVAPASGPSLSYRYNGDNLLVERQENGVKTRYYYDGLNIIAEGIVQADGTVTEKMSYLRGNGLVMQERSGGQKGYYQHNGHGDVVSIRSANGTVLNEYTYDIWGNTLTATETVANSFRYSGEYWDESADLQYLRARWYDPSVGRFMNEDTYEGDLVNPLSLNLYTYVENNPLTHIDPTGHSKVEFLNQTLHDYASGNITTQQMVEKIIDKNGSESVYTAFHEITQVMVATKLFYMDPNHVLPVLEARTKSGEIDIKHGNEIYEVKPKGGESGNKQLKKYLSDDPSYVKGSWVNSVNDLLIVDGTGATPDLFMKIEWTAPGKIKYSFYHYDQNNNRKQVTNANAMIGTQLHYFLDLYDSDDQNKPQKPKPKPPVYIPKGP